MVSYMSETLKKKESDLDPTVMEPLDDEWRILVSQTGFEDPWTADPFLRSFKIVRNWIENKISTQLTDVTKLSAIGMALLITLYCKQFTNLWLYFGFSFSFIFYTLIGREWVDAKDLQSRDVTRGGVSPPHSSLVGISTNFIHDPAMEKKFKKKGQTGNKT